MFKTTSEFFVVIGLFQQYAVCTIKDIFKKFGLQNKMKYWSFLHPVFAEGQWQIKVWSLPSRSLWFFLKKNSNTCWLLQGRKWLGTKLLPWRHVRPPPVP